MPVSSPSYFPPQRYSDRIVGLNAGIGQTGNRVFLAGFQAGTYSEESDIIIIGSSAFSAGTAATPVTDANGQYSVIIGSKTAPLLTDFTTFYNVPGPAIIIGGDTLGSAVSFANSIAIGTGIAVNYNPNPLGGVAQAYAYDNLVIGNQIMANVPAAYWQNWSRNVVIGQAACYGNGASTVNSMSFTENVVIGEAAQSQSDLGSGSGCGQNVIIGWQAALTSSGGSNILIGSSVAPSLTTGGENIVIGTSAGVAAAGTMNVVIGHNAGNGDQQNVCIGAQTAMAGTVTYSVILGAAQSNVELQSNRCTLIGNGAGFGDACCTGTTATDTFIAETYDGTTRRSLLFGVMGDGNLIVGDSVPGTNRDFGGTGATNVLKLINGTAGNADPVGGGYFYVVAGALHWVSSSGVDTTLAPVAVFPSGITVGTAQLIASNVALTNNAAAAVATLSNAPVAGNPTKWIPISDNGTIRNIPAW